MAQEWNPERYARNAAFVPELGRALVDLLAPQNGERILDLGCGRGELSREIARRGARVVGVDSSAAMVEAARREGIDARQVDGYDLPFHGEFEAVFSNAALHWMKRDPDAVIRGVHRALVPNGRFVGELGGAGNVAEIRAALRAEVAARGLDPERVDPWFFPTAEEYRARLEFGGFVVDELDLFPRVTPLPTGIDGWLETFAAPYFLALPAEERPTARARVIERLLPTRCDARGNWTADYVRLRFRAHRGSRSASPRPPPARQQGLIRRGTHRPAEPR
jgi:SAM-dependent methyltransferase